MLIDKRQVAVLVGGFCAFTSLYPIQALVPTLMQDFDASATEVGVAVAASPLAVALVAPFIGMASDRLGRKSVMVVSLACLGVTTVLSARATSIAELIAWRFLIGLFLPGVFAVLIAYIREEWDARDAIEAVGYYMSGSLLGGFGGRFIAGWAAEHWNWEAGLVAIGSLNLMMLWVLVRWLPASRNFRATDGVLSSIVAMRAHLANRRLLGAFAIAFGTLFGLVGAFTFVSLHLALPPFNLGSGATGSVFAVYLLGAVVTPIAGKLFPRFGRRPIVLASLVIGMLGLSATLWPDLWLIILGLALFAASGFIIQTATTDFVPQMVTTNASAAIGLYVSCYYIGSALGAIVPSVFWREFGWIGCVLLIGLVQVAIAFLSYRLWSDRRSLPAQQREQNSGSDRE